MMDLRRYFLACSALAAAYVSCSAQTQAAVAPYKFDIGVNIGMSGYIGDANTTNPFSHPGFTADISSRYIIDTRWALKASLSTMGLSGNTADLDNVLPDGAQFDFTSQVYDLGFRGEFNFLPYGIGETYKHLRRISPYLALGIGLSLASCDGETVTSFSLPMAFGVKFKLKERINLLAEFSMTKIFSDKVDQIYEVNMIKTEFYKSTDWVARFTIGISYEFGKRCETCHYVD